jgi:hypothetical protein
MGNALNKDLMAKRIVHAMARGAVVLDENLANLAEGLRNHNIHVISVPKKMDDEEIKRVYLTRRLFITNNPVDFIDDASSYEYGIISTRKIKYKGEDRLVPLISRALTKHKLWSQTYGFIIELDDDGDGEIKPLQS